MTDNDAACRAAGLSAPLCSVRGRVRAAEDEGLIGQLEDFAETPARRRHDARWSRGRAAIVVAPNAPGLGCSPRHILAASLARDVLRMTREDPLRDVAEVVR